MSLLKSPRTISLVTSLVHVHKYPFQKERKKETIYTYLYRAIFYPKNLIIAFILSLQPLSDFH